MEYRYTPAASSSSHPVSYLALSCDVEDVAPRPDATDATPGADRPDGDGGEAHGDATPGEHGPDGDGDGDCDGDEKKSQSIQAPSSTHPGISYPVRANPSLRLYIIYMCIYIIYALQYISK